jgi:ABC-2 type transport system permease protein
MTRVRRAMRAYRAYVRSSLVVGLQYRFGLFAVAFGILLWILLLTQVWQAAYRGRPSVGGLTLETTVVYLTLANLQAAVIDSPLSWVMAGRVRTGEVLFDVGRPVGFAGQMLALHTGQSLTRIIVMVLVSPLAALVGGLSAPAGLTAGLFYPVALLLGFLLNALLSLLVGLSSFWTVDNNGLATLFRFVAAFLAGASVPLTLLPGPVRALAEALPFRFIVYEPAAIYVGLVHGPDVLGGFLLALLWIVVLAGAVALVWRRAYRRMAVHGG